MKVKKPTVGMKAEAPSYDTQGWVSKQTSEYVDQEGRRSHSREWWIVLEVVGSVWVQGGRPCFLGLPLSRSEPGVRPAITNMYNI